MNKVTVTFGAADEVYYVPYAIARAINILLSHIVRKDKYNGEDYDFVGND